MAAGGFGPPSAPAELAWYCSSARQHCHSAPTYPLQHPYNTPMELLQERIAPVMLLLFTLTLTVLTVLLQYPYTPAVLLQYPTMFLLYTPSTE